MSALDQEADIPRYSTCVCGNPLKSIAAASTNWYGHEGSILRFVFPHSIVLACLVGLLVMLQAYVHPFTAMVLK